MKQPFIIWTMRRTGGTSLANAIAQVGNYQIEHEPFNWDRRFGFMTKDFSNNRKNFDALSAHLQEHCIDKRICVKHCYEVVGDVLNKSLVELFAKAGYKQIIWYRQNELLRLMSLYTAKQTDVWGKHGARDAYNKYLSGELGLKPYDIDSMKFHYHSCQRMTQAMKERVASTEADYKELTFEDFYRGELDERKSVLKSVCNWLEVPEIDFEEGIGECSYKLMEASQNSSSLYSKVPNIQTIVETFPDYELSL